MKKALIFFAFLIGVASAQIVTPPAGGGSGSGCAPVSSPTANLLLMDNGSGCPVDGTSSATIPAITYLGTTATNAASLGPELTTSGTCSGTGWTGTYPNYVAPGTTAPLTCTGFTNGQFYQTVTTIGAGGSGSVTIAIGTAQTASGSSGTVTAGLKANGTSLTFTPAATYTGTIGISAKLISPITVFTQTGEDSTGAISYQSLFQQSSTLHNVFAGGGGSYNTTGLNNVASGSQALYSNTTGYDNTASGSQALYSNTTGYNNTASGYVALYSNTTGFNNAANGYQALYSNTTGYNNAANGTQALFSNTTGNYNAANGYAALFSNTTGSYNTANGVGAGYTATAANANVSGSNNVWEGYDSGPGTTTQLSNSIGIGYQALTMASNTAVIGNASITDAYFGSTSGAASLHATSLISGGTKFTISGCSATTTTGGAAAGSFLSGTTGTCTVVITLNGATGITAPNGWSCHASDLTTPANLISQSASSATTCTITGTTVSGDKIQFMAMAF